MRARSCTPESEDPSSDSDSETYTDADEDEQEEEITETKRKTSQEDETTRIIRPLPRRFGIFCTGNGKYSMHGPSSQIGLGFPFTVRAR